MKYGFFLGSFDPPHLGHFAVVEKVLKEGLVDHVIMVPAPQNPWKKEKPASLGIRYWMCVDGLKELGLSRFSRGIMWLMKEIFNLETTHMPMEPLEEEGQFLLNKLMNDGFSFHNWWHKLWHYTWHELT